MSEGRLSAVNLVFMLALNIANLLTVWSHEDKRFHNGGYTNINLHPSMMETILECPSVDIGYSWQWIMCIIATVYDEALYMLYIDTCHSVWSIIDWPFFYFFFFII